MDLSKRLLFIGYVLQHFIQENHIEALPSQAFEPFPWISLDTDLMAVPVEQHIVGLEVGVHEPAGMRRGQPLARLRELGHHGAPRMWPVTQSPGETAAVDVLHRDE